MDEYIRRGAAIEIFDGIPSFGSTAKMLIDYIPAADVVEVRRGEWMPIYPTGAGLYRCSLCKTIGSNEWDYCPNCGASMGGKSDTPADVVEVVRCENCQHSDLINCERWCTLHDMRMNDNDFCSYGIKKMEREDEE